MNQVDTVTQKKDFDHSSIVNILDDIIHSFEDIECASGGCDGQEDGYMESTDIGRNRADSDVHHVLDLVQEYAGHVSDVMRDLKVLRKALPATYFKNRSKIRDAFEGMELTSKKCQANAFAIMDALQSRELNSKQAENVGVAIRGIKVRLTRLLDALGGHVTDG